MPDVTTTLLAMYQQIIGGSTAREQSALEAECARRVITSGLTIAANGAFTIPGSVTISGSLTVSGAFSVTGLLTVGSLAVTGNTTIGGVLSVTGFGGHSFIAGGVGGQNLTLQNTLAGTANATQLILTNDGPASGILQVQSSTFTASGPTLPNGVAFFANGVGGLSVVAQHASGALRFYSGGTTERMRLHPSGGVSIGNTTDPGAAGLLSVSGFGVHTVQGSGVGLLALNVTNTLAGTGNQTQLQIGNDALATLTQLSSFSSTWATAAPNVANGSRLAANGVGGLSIVANDPTGAIRVYTNANAERMRITAVGEVLLNAQAPILLARVLMVADQSANNGLVLQNSSGANNGNFVLFGNSAGAVAGSIAQTAVTTVNYATTSDARLKDDLGRADDLTALRGVVIHDFTWTADGRHDRGVFAQDAAVVFPRAVVPGTDETTPSGALQHPWMTDYSKFVADLIVGWQQHDAELAELRAQLAQRRH